MGLSTYNSPSQPCHTHANGTASTSTATRYYSYFPPRSREAVLFLFFLLLRVSPLALVGVWIASPACICVHVGACKYVLVHEKEEQKLASSAALIRVCWAQRPGFSFHLLTPTPPFDPKYWFDRQTRSCFCGAAAGCVSAVSCCAVLYCAFLYSTCCRKVTGNAPVLVVPLPPS